MLQHEEPMNSVNYNHLITLSSSDKIVTKVKINVRRKRRQLQKLIKKGDNKSNKKGNHNRSQCKSKGIIKEKFKSKRKGNNCAMFLDHPNEKINCNVM